MNKRQKFMIRMLLVFTLIFTFITPDIAYSTANAATTASVPVSLSKTAIYLAKGETTTLKVTGTSKKVAWSSSDKSIATVSNTGKVTAVDFGDTYIKAAVNKKTYKCKAVVVDSSDIYLNPSSHNVSVGGTGVNLNPSSYNYSSAMIKGMKLTYKVSGNTGVKVSSTGVVTAAEKGAFKVTAYFHNKVVNTISMEAVSPFSGFEVSELSMPADSTACRESRDVNFANGFKIDCDDYFAANPASDDIGIVSSDPAVATAKGSFTTFLDDRSDYYYGIYIETGKDGIATLSLTVSGVTKSIKVIVGRGVTVLDPVSAVKQNNFTGYDKTETETLTWVRNFIDTNNLDSDALTDREKITIVQNYLNETYHTNMGDTTSAYYRRILFGGVWNPLGDCGTYSDIFCFLMECIDIEVWECLGVADNSEITDGHAWNKVKADGTWYYIDSYWCAALKNSTYFLSKTLWPDHVLDENLTENDYELYFGDDNGDYLYDYGDDPDVDYEPGYEPIYTWSDDEVHEGCEGTYEDLNYGAPFVEAGFGLAWY